jgi:hypothetical protein
MTTGFDSPSTGEAVAAAKVTAALPALNRATAAEIYRGAVVRYVAGCRSRVGPFVDKNFSFLGSLRLHRAALGLDIVRAPANVALVMPQLAVHGVGAAAGALGLRGMATWLKQRRIFLETDIGRELMWLLHTQLLELPYADGARTSSRDALAAEVLVDARVSAVLGAALHHLAAARTDPRVQARLQLHLETYGTARHATAELFNNLTMAGAGAGALQQLTPSALSLGPALAAAVAKQAAVASFPLGASAGGLWYGIFTAVPSTGLVVGITSGVALLAAALTPFTGIVTDPLQRRLGLHHRRLEKLVDALGQELAGESAAAFRVRDHYVARIFDVIDLVRAATAALARS